MAKRTMESKNYLDYIPSRTDLKYKTDADGTVTLFVENKGLFNKIAQLLFKKPKTSQIHHI